MPGQSRRSGGNKTKYGLGKASQRIELELPSGETCLVVRPGVQGLIGAGILDSLDTLTGLVQSELIDSKDPRNAQKAVKALAENPQDLLKAMDLVDKVVCYVVKAPEVLMPPADASERDAEALYADEVDLDDKMFIFQFVVGGTRDIEQFRKESQELLGGVPAFQDVSLPTE